MHAVKPLRDDAFQPILAGGAEDEIARRVDELAQPQALVPKRRDARVKIQHRLHFRIIHSRDVEGGHVLRLGQRNRRGDCLAP